MESSVIGGDSELSEIQTDHRPATADIPENDIEHEDEDTVFYVIMKDYPRTIGEVEALVEERANFDAVILIHEQTRKGPPGMTPEEEELREQKKDEASTGRKRSKNAKPGASRPKSGSKKPSSAKVGKRKNAEEEKPSDPFFMVFKKHQDHMRRENLSSSVREVMYFELTQFIYQYDDNDVQHDQGDDMERELKRLARDITDTIGYVMKFQHTYNSLYRINDLKSRLVTGISLQNIQDNHYQKLLSGVPEHLASIPVIVHCLVEQVARTVAEENSTLTHNDSCDESSIIHEQSENNHVSKVLEMTFAEFMDPPTKIDHSEPGIGLEEETEISKAPEGKTIETNDEGLKFINRNPSVKLIDYGDKIADRALDAMELYNGVTTSHIEKEMSKLLPVFTWMDCGNVSMDESDDASVQQAQTEAEAIQDQEHNSSAHDEESTSNYDIPPITNSEERSIRKSELFHFLAVDHSQPQKEYRMTKKQMEKELTIIQFEDLLRRNGVDATLEDRLFCQEYSKESLIQVLSEQTLLHNYDIFSEYYDLEDVALIAFCKKIPQQRFEHIPWLKRFSVPCTFAEWVETERVKFSERTSRDFEKLYEETQMRLRKEDIRDGGEQKIESIQTDEAQIEISLERTIDPAEENCNLQQTERQPWYESRLCDEQTELYVVEGRGADLYRDTVYFYPNDGALIVLESLKSVEQSMMCSVYKDGALFNIKRLVPEHNLEVFENLNEYQFSVTYECGTRVVVGFEKTNFKNPSIKSEEKEGHEKQEEEDKDKEHSKTITDSGTSQDESDFQPMELENADSFVSRDKRDCHSQEVLHDHANRKNTELSLGSSSGLYLRMVSDGALHQSYIMDLNANIATSFSGFDIVTKQRQDHLTEVPQDEMVQTWCNEKNVTITVTAKEAMRIHMSNGDIIRRFNLPNMKQIMHPNGNTSTQNANGYWLKISKDGSRMVESPTGDQIEIDVLGTAVNIDPQTLAEVYSREDRVMIVRYPDSNSTMVQHVDGTRFWQYSRKVKNEVTGEEVEGNDMQTIQYMEVLMVEKNGFATVEYTDFRGAKQLMHTEIAELGARICFSDWERQVSLWKDGHHLIVSLDTHHVDVQPSSLIFQKPRSDHHLYGIYSFNYRTGNFKTIDLDGHGFVIKTSSGASLVRYANIASSGTEKNIHLDDFYHREHKQVNGTGIPPVMIQGRVPGNTYIHPPRIFAISRSDGSGREYLGEEYVLPLIHSANNDGSNTALSQDSFDNATVSLTFLTKRGRSSMIVKPDLPIPKSVLPLPNESLLKRRAYEDRYPTVFYHRCITQFKRLSHEERQRVRNGLEDWKKWFIRREIHADDMALPKIGLDTRTDQEIQEAAEVQERVATLMEKISLSTESEDEHEVDDNEDSEEYSDSDNSSVIYHGKDIEQADQEIDMGQQPLRQQQHASPVPHDREEHLRNILTIERKLLEPVYSHPGLRYWEISESGKQFLEKQKSNSFLGARIKEQIGQRRASGEEGDNQAESEQPREKMVSPGFRDEMETTSSATMSGEGDVKEEAQCEINVQNKTREKDIRGRVKTSSIVQTSQKYAHADPFDSISNFRSRNFVAEPDVPKISVYPPEIDFGTLKIGEVYRATALLTNFGHTPGRFLIKHHNNLKQCELKVLYKKGPIAPGMSVRVNIDIYAEKTKDMDYELVISTEGHNITLPIKARIIAEQQFESEASVLHRKVKVITGSRLPRT